MEKKISLTRTAELVGEVLKQAKEHGLEIEVVSSALVHLKDNPELDISVALHYALSDWDI